MNYKNWTEEQKIAHILEVLSREDLSAELTELIQGWILYEESADRKDVVMDAILERMFREHRRPVQRTFESLAGMHERLGFTDTEVRAGRRVPLRRTLTRVAAVVVALMVLGGGAVWYLSRQTASVIPVSPTMVEVVEGEGGEMVLPDGSTVRPVGDSRVTVAENFTEKRRVTLSGEAFFSVVPNAESPFTVETEKLTLTVLGTEFNLKALPGESEAEVSLVTGSVRIESGTESVVLAPMERLTYDKATGESEVSSFTPEQIDRWRRRPLFGTGARCGRRFLRQRGGNRRNRTRELGH